MKAFAVALTFATALGVKLQQNLPVTKIAGEVFKAIDTSQDGNMTSDELEGALTHLGFPADIVTALGTEFEHHPDTQGSVTEAEFVDYMNDLYAHGVAMGVTDAEIE
jgi:Ca2+-binding EF-hand superfamily protein